MDGPLPRGKSSPFYESITSYSENLKNNLTKFKFQKSLNTIFKILKNDNEFVHSIFL